MRAPFRSTAELRAAKGCSASGARAPEVFRDGLGTRRMPPGRDWRRRRRPGAPAGRRNRVRRFRRRRPTDASPRSYTGLASKRGGTGAGGSKVAFLQYLEAGEPPLLLASARQAELREAVCVRDLRRFAEKPGRGRRLRPLRARCVKGVDASAIGGLRQAPTAGAGSFSSHS